nr:MAG TPA: hypothetical protein [Caudoviricetes sp.]
MSIPHFQTPQYYSDLDTLAKLQKLFESQASAKRQEELHPFELSKAEKMNTRLDLMNEAGRQDIDFDKELHPYEVAYKQAVAEGQGILNKSNQQKMDFDAELHPIDMIYQRALADSAKATADFDKSTLQAKINDKLDEYSFNRNERPLKLSEIKARINSSNASTNASNANTARLNYLLDQDKLAAKKLEDFENYVKQTTGYSPEEFAFNNTKKEYERLQKRQQQEDAFLENADLVFDPEQKKFVAVPKTTVQNNKDSTVQAYLDAASFGNKTYGATYKPWNMLSPQDQKTLEEAGKFFENNPQKMSAIMNGLQLTNGTTTLPKDAQEEAIKVAEELMAGRQQQSNPTDVAQLVSQSMKQGNADKLYDRASQGDANAIAALQFMVENNPTATKAFYLNPKTKEMQELPQGYGNYINQNTSGGLAKSGVANGVYYQRPFESFEHVSKNIPGNIGTYKNTSGQVQDLPERGSDYSENVRLIQNVSKALDKPIYHKGQETKEVIAGKVGNYIKDLLSGATEEQQKRFKNAINDPKNGLFAQRMLAVQAYVMNTRGDLGLAVKNNPLVLDATLAVMENPDVQSYNNIILSGAGDVYGNRAKDTITLLDDLRIATKEYTQNLSKDGSFNTSPILRQNKNSLYPTVDDGVGKKRKELPYNIEYLTPSDVKVILNNAEKSIRARNKENITPIIGNTPFWNASFDSGFSGD